MEKKIKLKITTISTGNPVSVIKGEGTYREKDGRVLITQIDGENNKTAFIITEEKIMLIRRSPYYQLKIPVKANEETNGIMGEENIFTVLGKTALFEKSKKSGRAYLEYTLPDLSDESADFKVELEFEF